MSSDKSTLRENECHKNATDFVDIYLDQMKHSVLYALVKFQATDQYALISHGAVSKTELPTKPGTIPETETDSRKNTVVKLEDGIKEIEAGMIEIAVNPDPNEWLSLISSLTSASNVNVYYDRRPYNYTGAYTDVTGSFSNIKGGRKPALISNISQLNTSNRVLKLDTVLYRISGHTPTGYMGLVKKGSNNNYYFCTDVSKTDKQVYKNKNRYTCCFLILEPDQTKMKSRFIGRFVIEPSDIKTSNLVITPSDRSKPLYVNYSIDVDASNPQASYLSLPELKYGDRVVKFSYDLVGPEKNKNVTLYDAKAARLENDRMASSSRLSSREIGDPFSLGLGGTRRRKYSASTTTKKSKKMKITKKQNYKNKRTSQTKHKKSRK